MMRPVDKLELLLLRLKSDEADDIAIATRERLEKANKEKAALMLETIKLQFARNS